MLPKDAINIADKLIEAFDLARPAPIEFNSAHQRAAENLAQSGLHRGAPLVMPIRNAFAGYLTEKANIVLDSLKRAMIATRVEPYPDLVNDLKAELDKHLGPTRQDAAGRLKKLLASLDVQPNALAHPSLTFNEIMLKVHAEAELFCAEYVTNFNLNLKTAGPVFNNFSGIYGDVTNSQVTLYDFSTIYPLLKGHAIAREDRNELEDIMDALRISPPERTSSLMQQAEKWITQHKDALGAAVEMIYRAIGKT